MIVNTQVDWGNYHNRLRQIPIIETLDALGVDTTVLAHKKHHVLCPVHGETEASLFVNEDANTTYCFGACRRFFDPIGIWAGVKRLNWKAAADELGKFFGVIPTDPNSKPKSCVTPKPVVKREQGKLPEVLPDCEADKYHDRLTKTDREYLCNLLAVEEWAIDWFKLGVKTESPRALVFPVFDQQGGLLNLRFRRDDRYQQPEGLMKYWGIPGRNGALPFGLWGLQESDFIILTEGEKSVLSLAAYGLPAITLTTGVNSRSWEDWVHLLDGYKKWIVIFDDDQAGHDATAGMLLKWPGKVVPFPWPKVMGNCDKSRLPEIAAQYTKKLAVWGGIDLIDYVKLYSHAEVVKRIKSVLKEAKWQGDLSQAKYWYGWGKVQTFQWAA